MNLALESALQRAIAEAQRFVGATSPNPPVGASALNAQGHILSTQAHQKAGMAHAEAAVLDDCATRGVLQEINTLVITLEPCNHQGRTPPCTEAILKSGIKRVLIGTPDPNPHVKGHGARRLQEAGIEVFFTQNPKLQRACLELIEPFSHWTQTGLPWITVKTAHLKNGSMIPPKGQKTFTSEASLRFAHQLRKRADAVITGSGTVLADLPELTVRHVPDHPNKKRWLILLDRRKRVHQIAPQWLENARSRGFEIIDHLELEPALRFLGEQGCLEALVEAGPEVSQNVLAQGFWNRHFAIHLSATTGSPDRIEDHRRV